MIREISRKQIDLKTAQGERVILIEALASSWAGPAFDRVHIAGAWQFTSDTVRERAETYIPNPGSEIVIYGETSNSEEAEGLARQMQQLGYRNLYLYRGGKEDWLGAGGFEESVHYPPQSGTQVEFDNSPPRTERPTSATSNQPQVPGLRLHKGLDAISREGGSDPRMTSTGPWQPGGDPVAAVPVNGTGVDLRKYLGGAVAILAVYAGCQAILRIVHELKRFRIVRDPLDADQGTEGLFAHEQHRVVRIHEDCGLEKEASSFHAASAAE